MRCLDGRKLPLYNAAQVRLQKHRQRFPVGFQRLILPSLGFFQDRVFSHSFSMRWGSCSRTSNAAIHVAATDGG